MTSTTTIRLAVTGGGTGGHTYPALTTINTIRTTLAARDTDLDVTWYGTPTGLEARVAADAGIRFRTIATGKVRRSLNPKALASTTVDLAKVPAGLGQAVAELRRLRPHVVLSTGGYVAVPLGLAARLTGAPLVMHEQITTLGLANRILARGATAIALSHATSLEALPPAARQRAVVTGNPVRPALFDGDPAAAHRAHQLDPDTPLVYVTGGAQGSAQINRLITDNLQYLLPHCQILHQCGAANHEQLKQKTAGLAPEHARRYRLVPYVSDGLADILAAADIVISRSGAGTLAELTAIGKPSILIPLIPTAGQEQLRNAQTLQTAGAALCLDSTTATPGGLRDALLPLLKDPDRRQAMARAARTAGQPDAAQRLADLVVTTALRPTR
ncbi:UDP-N-acetylglucosamine--N-acetylmuramyl-(pentapeptide) pyrophosphoryl-undecaprenol N-acetylglucosamine transferase [Streptomyces sp. NPDC053792]|uniref:UDP-N-acetylglucosamine--N-acetylmuramyl- (pentapeptide) pyrophosphoryl-undecaprenol N-acetylglucosamine transferase n=1 Tax=Streptomyces sp. NPDC053792 TaxID=3365716 RepID=UPI0037D97B83